MAVRVAKFSDIPAMSALITERHAESVYAGTPVEVDVSELKSILLSCIGRHGKHTRGGTCVLVSESDGEVCGLIVGILDRIHSIGTMLQASDLFFIVRKGATARDVVGLLAGFEQWATACPKVYDIVNATPDIVGGSERAGKVLSRLGWSNYGGMWRKVVAR